MRVAFGELYIDEPEKFKEDRAAFINSKYVVSLEVVEFAAIKALKNWNEGKRISKSFALEVLLYYAATRQIKDAVKLGVSRGHNRVAAVILDERFTFKETKFVPEYDLKALKDHYQITDEELSITGIEKLPLLIRERIALFAAFEEGV